MEFKIGFPNCDIVFTQKAVAIPTISETLYKEFPLSAFYWPAIWQLTDAAGHYVLGINLVDLPTSFWEASPFRDTKKKKIPVNYKRATALAQSFSSAVKKLAAYYSFMPEHAFSEFALHTGADGNFVVPIWIVLLFIRQEEVLLYFSLVIEELGNIPEPHEEFAADTVTMLKSVHSAVKFMFDVRNLNNQKVKQNEKIRQLEDRLKRLQDDHEHKEAILEGKIAKMTSELGKAESENIALKKQIKRLEPKNTKIDKRPLKKKKK